MTHHPLRRIALFIVALGWTAVTRGDTPLQDYVDPQYHFAFQYPSDWTLDTRTQPGKGGEMRVAVRDAQSSARAVASIGQVGTTLTKAQVETVPERERIAQGLIDMTIKDVYTRASEALHGKQMIIANKQMLPSDDGIMFHISTLQTIGEDQIVIAGMHLIPFGQSHMISFIMMSPFKVDPAKQQAINAVLKSFRFVTP